MTSSQLRRSAYGQRFLPVRRPSRRVLLDVGGAVLTAVYALTNDHFDAHRAVGTGGWAFNIALAVPLIWRRRNPLAVFLTVSAVAAIQWLANVPTAGDIAVLIALYAVGAYQRRWQVVAAAAAVGELGGLLAVLRWAPADTKLTALVLLTGTLTAAWALGVYSRTRRAYITSVLDRAATAERERDQQALFAVAAERARISREMHDIVAHSLSVIIALSDGASMSVQRSPEAARDAMEQASTLGRQALGEMHRLLGVLREPAELTPQPGIAQLDELVAQVRAAGLAVDLVVIGQPENLTPGAELAVYRLVQEGLTNVLKHARSATRATVTLRCTSAGIDIDVDNDDHPEGAQSQPARAGHGLAGMRERAAVFDGTVEAFRRPDGGWHVGGHLSLADSR